MWNIFKYMIDLLKERGAPQINVYGGGGGVIVKEEIDELHKYGVNPDLLAPGRPENGPCRHDPGHDRNRPSGSLRQHAKRSEINYIQQNQ